MSAGVSENDDVIPAGDDGMTEWRGTVATLAVGVVGLVALSAGVASAAPSTTYRGAYSLPYPDQISCDAASASRSDPPDLVTYLCSYYATNPNGAGPTGWFYYYKYAID
jgi:hypothetical protein